ncbi:MAG: oligosaccharide flippase family protein, partial [Pseudomonadota bacterium]
VVYRAIRVSLGFILFSLAVPRRPRMQFDGPLAKQATRYASGLYGSRGMTFTANFGTDLILAYLFSTAESGLYRFANRLATAVVDIIGQPLRSFALKSFGQAARESGSLDTVFARFVGANVFLMGGFAVTSVVLGEALIRFAFRPDYAAAITAFYALSVLAAARSGTALIEPSFAARKTTWVAMYYNAAWAFVMIGAVVLSAPQGIATVAMAQAVVQIAASAGALFVIGRWARVDLSEGLRNLVWALALVALYAGLFFAGWTAIQTMPLDNAWQLTIGLAAAVVIAVAVSAIALRLRVLQLAVFAD